MKKLKYNSYILLRDCIKKHNNQLLSFIDDNNRTVINNGSINDLRGIVCDELIMCGFTDGKINDYGEQLEILIDELGQLIF